MQRLLMVTAAVAALIPLGAPAQEQPAPSICQAMIDDLTTRLSDAGGAAASSLGLSTAQLQATERALDGARAVADSDHGGCLTMVSAARAMLARGATAFGGPVDTVALDLWEYGPLYDNSWRAQLLIDQPTFDESGEEIGEVHDILLTPDGTVTGIIVEGGGFLDIGDTHARVKWEGVRFRGDGAEDGVVVPLDKDKMTDFSLFDADDAGEPQVRHDEVRATALLGERVQFNTGEPFGNIGDLLISNGKVEATVIRPDVGYGAGFAPYATPYYAYGAGFNPGYDFYVLPYDADQLGSLDPFEIDRVKGPTVASEPEKGS